MNTKQIKKEFIEKRLDYIEKNICKFDKEINRTNIKIEFIFREIKDKLPDKYKSLIHEYDILVNYKIALEGEIKYKTGFSDGIKTKSVRYLCGKNRK